MNILCLIDSLGPGGAQRQMTNIAILMKQRGHHVTIVIYYPLYFFRDILEMHGVTVVCINEPRWWMRLWKIRSLIRGGTQDAVLSFLNTPNFIACISAIGGRRWGLIIGERSAQKSSFTHLRNKTMKLFAWQADFIVTNSNIARNMWVKAFPFFLPKLRTIYNAVMIEAPISNEGSPTSGYRNTTIVIDNSIDQRVGICQPNGSEIFNADKKFVLLVAASYQQLKNINGVIEAVSLLDNLHKKRLSLHWYGQIEATRGNSQPYQDALRKITQNNLSGIINLHAPSNNIHTLIMQASAVGLFSHYEGLPNFICEAMVLAKPIIMTHVSDTNALVDDSNGFLCHAADAPSIAEAIKRAMDCPIEKLKLMGQRSAEKSHRLFQPEVIADSYFTLLRMASNKAKGI